MSELILRPFQAKDVERMEKLGGRVLNANPMGLGKTVETIAWWMRHQDVVPVIVVCPADIKWHWEDEFKRFANVRCDILDGQRPRTRPPMAPAKVVILNYDIAKYWVKYIRSLNPQLIIVDECQKVRSPDRQVGRKESQYSQQTIAVRRICKGVPHVMGLGGTGALENTPAEMFAILNIIQPDEFPSFFTYAAKYCSPTRKPWGWEYKGATNLDHLHRKLKRTMMIRNNKEEVLPELPERNRIVIPMRDLSLRDYNEMEKNFRVWLRQHHADKKKLKGEQRAEALNKLGMMLRTCGLLKLKSIIQWVENFLAEDRQKIILFALHRRVIQRLSYQFDGRCVTVHGSTTKDRRKSARIAFNNDPKCVVFVGQLKAAGVGWSAKDCSVTGTCEYWWNPSTHTQADDRVYGMHRGQEGKPCFNYYFTAKGTIEEKLCMLLQKKQANIDMVLDGKQVTKFNLLDQLIQELTR